jgi:hypothetical protein
VKLPFQLRMNAERHGFVEACWPVGFIRGMNITNNQAITAKRQGMLSSVHSAFPATEVRTRTFTVSPSSRNLLLARLPVLSAAQVNF